MSDIEIIKTENPDVFIEREKKDKNIVLSELEGQLINLIEENNKVKEFMSWRDSLDEEKKKYVIELPNYDEDERVLKEKIEVLTKL